MLEVVTEFQQASLKTHRHMQEVGKRLAIQVMQANFHAAETMSDNRQLRNYRQLGVFAFSFFF